MVSAMTTIFSEVFTWLQSAITAILELFYTEGDFTVLGVLAIVGLSISMFFLLVGVITNFLQLRS